MDLDFPLNNRKTIQQLGGFGFPAEESGKHRQFGGFGFQPLSQNQQNVKCVSTTMGCGCGGFLEAASRKIAHVGRNRGFGGFHQQGMGSDLHRRDG